MEQIRGSQSIEFTQAPFLISSASVVGSKESEGPLGKLFDMVNQDDLFGAQTWEEAESTMQKEACVLALGKAHVDAEKVDIYMGEIYCVRELQLRWEWKPFRFQCLVYMVHVQHQERRWL